MAPIRKIDFKTAVRMERWGFVLLHIEWLKWHHPDVVKLNPECSHFLSSDNITATQAKKMDPRVLVLADDAEADAWDRTKYDFTPSAVPVGSPRGKIKTIIETCFPEHQRFWE